MNSKIIIILIVLTLMFTFMMYNHFQISKIRISKVSFESDKVIGKVRISQITDFHSNDKIDLEDIYNKVASFNPHIIVLTGDIIDFKTRNLSIAYSLIDSLNRINKPIYFVKGNHEFRNPMDLEFENGLIERGVIFTQGQKIDLTLEDNQISIFGAGFLFESWDYDKLYSSLNKNNYNILLSHSPNRPVLYLHDNIDLILSGHTHGGQVRLPIIGGILSPGEGLFPKYDKGIIKIDDNTILYIDSGLGNSLLPIRFLNPVQISELTIN